jgi:NTE family protein
MTLRSTLRDMFGLRPGSPAGVAPSARLRLGLALGGGGVRGAAHLGVLSVLEREGIAFDVVAGTSVGAVVGAGVAAGVSSADMLARFRTARWIDLARPSWGSRLSMLQANPMGEILVQTVQAETFEELALPFAVSTSDILTGQTVVISEGPLREAVLASAAVPAIFEPLRREGRLLVDGGLTDNLPVQVARDLGADLVIAVDIMPPLDGSYEPKDINEMVMLSWNIVQRACETGRKHADVVITPKVATVSLMDFAQAQTAYDAGVAAAEEAMDEVWDAIGGRRAVSAPAAGRA